ncbi:hypothetical protein LPJ81_003916 [Coemansia sp. IMI 209127]|nr:hypothetical protein LPJ81_003916 [Coemansia sp. IMI 209127]
MVYQGYLPNPRGRGRGRGGGGGGGGSFGLSPARGNGRGRGRGGRFSPYTRNERDSRDEDNYRYRGDAGDSTPPMHYDANPYREPRHYENKHRRSEKATMTGMPLMSAIPMPLIPHLPVVLEAIATWVSALTTDPEAEVVLRPEAEAEVEEEDHMVKEAYGGIGADPRNGWLTADAIQPMKVLTMDFPLQLTAATSSMAMNMPMVR